jgi:hypothetical protein
LSSEDISVSSSDEEHAATSNGNHQKKGKYGNIIITGALTLCQVSVDQVGKVCRSDLDSHDDACVVGQESIFFQYCGRPVNIIGYDPKGPGDMSLITVFAGIP